MRNAPQSYKLTLRRILVEETTILVDADSAAQAREIAGSLDDPPDDRWVYVTNETTVSEVEHDDDGEPADDGEGA